MYPEPIALSALSKPPEVYQLRVTLRGVSSLIWCCVLVHGDANIADLHQILQIVFETELESRVESLSLAQERD